MTIQDHSRHRLSCLNQKMHSVESLAILGLCDSPRAAGLITSLWHYRQVCWMQKANRWWWTPLMAGRILILISTLTNLDPDFDPNHNPNPNPSFWVTFPTLTLTPT